MKLCEVANIDEVPDIATSIGDGEPRPIEQDPWFALAKDGADIATEKLPPVVEIVEGIVGDKLSSSSALAASHSKLGLRFTWPCASRIASRFLAVRRNAAACFT